MQQQHYLKRQKEKSEEKILDLERKDEEEIEKKFLLDSTNIEWRTQIKKSDILYQGYYKEHNVNKRIRINFEEQSAVVCYKEDIGISKGFIKRIEKEENIEFSKGVVLLIKSKSFIKKKRNFVEISNFTFEIDEFLNLQGKFSNLITAEVEVKEAEIDRFNELLLPKWIIKDISLNEEYRNAELINYASTEIESFIEIINNLNLAVNKPKIKF